MQKFLLLAVTFLFTLTSVNATTTTVRFNNGVPIYASRGGSRPVPVPHTTQHNYYMGKIKPTLPSRPPRTYGYARRIYIPPVVTNYYIPAPVHTTADATPSRFDRNNRVIIPTKSYTMNGVTYYN